MRKFLMFMSFMVAAVFTAALAMPGVASAEGDELEVKWFGYIQATAEVGEGNSGDNDGLRFGGDRIRIGYKAKQGNAFSKLQVDFAKTGTNILPGIIKDAEVGYKLHDAASVKAGMFKTPVGMDFNGSGTKLNITKRGMEKALVLERAAGLMASGRKIGPGFGYDVGVFNPTTRSSVVSGGTVGDDMAYAGRIMYDMGKTLHVEASYGVSMSAGDVPETATLQVIGGQGFVVVQDEKIGSEDYSVLDVGVAGHIAGATLKAEYISGVNMAGVDGNDQNVFFLHAGYKINSMFEPVIRHYQGDHDNTGTNLGNTFLGVNVFLSSAARVQLNYVVASGDELQWGGMGGYKANTFLAQYQIVF